MNEERRGLAECAGSAAAFGSVGVLVAIARHEHVATTTLLASRYAIGAIALWVVLLGLRRPLPGLPIALAAVALGATTFAAASGLYLAAIEQMGAGPAGVVSYCYPVLVMAGAILLGRERRLTPAHRRDRTGRDGRRAARRGRRARSDQRAGRPARVRIRVALHGLRPGLDRAARPRRAACALDAGGDGCGTAFAITHAVQGGAPVHTPVAALAVVALALVPTAFAVSTFLAGLGRIGPSRASIASSVEPVVAVACGVLVLGERLLPVQFLGAALVIAAVLAIELRRLPRIPVPPLPRIRVFPRLVPRLPRADSVSSSGGLSRVCPGGRFVVGGVVSEAAVEDADEPVGEARRAWWWVAPRARWRS